MNLLFWHCFPENSMKLKKNWTERGKGGASLTSASFNVDKFVVKNLSHAKVREPGKSKLVDAHVLVNCEKINLILFC